MRIVGGTYKGRTLFEFEKINVRPTSDKVRESLFNIIAPKIMGASFCDLFCGTGAVGIEAKSRGAGKVYLNDLSKESVSLAKCNLKKLGIEDIVVCQGDGVEFLKNTPEKFDFVFIDPPYKSELGYLSLLQVASCLNKNGIAIYESEQPFSYNIESLQVVDQRKYGRAHLTFLQRKENYKEQDGLVNCVFAGTFDPIHIGHINIIGKCAKLYNKVFVVLGENQSKKEYFTREQRLEILKTAVKEIDKVEVIDYLDYKERYIDFLNKNGVKVYVRGIRDQKDIKFEEKYKNKNQKIYPFINTIYISADSEVVGVSSTLIKEKIKKGESIKEYLPKNCYKLICNYKKQNKKTKNND